MKHYYTDKAMHALKEAQRVARDLGVSYVGTEHLLLGILTEQEGLGARIRRDAVRVPPIFELIARAGDIPERDMFNTFNMGVGMSIVVAKADEDRALDILRANGEDAYVIGAIQRSEEKIVIC